MVKLARLSFESMSELGPSQPEVIEKTVYDIHDKLLTWWQSCPSSFRDQSKDWRRQTRPCKLIAEETLEEEAFSSTRPCIMYSKNPWNEMRGAILDEVYGTRPRRKHTKPFARARRPYIDPWLDHQFALAETEGRIF
ncbi:hypothetical protein L207DRAFT_533195 [Hyaloscypha variabilis F]|uniref:Uncharacterized protein n=1 Tax=Hyaloscypha variabilis (strain UAMH 11265 / GT02V1 / F) TaxID=1149755 RepID=A0A2J6RCT7_HYAVF|nr:hypothetical protein L207DRAFT_533195 [Hyaloscypha variabilis F]